MKISLKSVFLAALLLGVLCSQHAFGALLFNTTPENLGDKDASFRQYTFGNRFEVTAPIVVTHLGYADTGGDGLDVAHQVGLWSDSTTLVESATVASGTAGTLASGFRFHELSSPLSLSPGWYVLAGDTTSNTGDPFRYAGSGIGTGKLNDGQLVTTVFGESISTSGFDRRQSAQSGGFVYPNQGVTSEGIWGNVNMQYDAAGDPGFVAKVQSYQPLAYWRFEEADKSDQATLVNSSASGTTHDGTYVNNGIATVAGLFGNAASFNGGSQGSPPSPANFADFPDTDFPSGNASRTVIAWLRGGKTTGDYGSAFEYGTWGSTGQTFALQQYTKNGEDRFQATQYGSAVVADTDSADEYWHFVAVTVEQGTAGQATWKIYVDGVEHDSIGLSTNTILDGLGRIAAYPNEATSISGWEGEIDELAVFDYALDGDDISAIYSAAFIPEPTSGLLLAAGTVALLAVGRQRRASRSRRRATGGRRRMPVRSTAR